MKTSVLFFILIYAVQASAQLDTTKLEIGWNHGVVAGLTFTQVAFTDWAAGGEDALAYNANINGKSVHEQEMTNWATAYKFAFGQANLSNKGMRKTDDVIDIESILRYKLNTLINPYVAVSFRTQFVDGFEYTDTNKTVISSFMDPGYARQAVGIGLNPIPEIKTRVGAALREVFTNNYHRWSDDPATTEIEKTKIEGGIEWVTEAEVKLDDNILFKSRLETFAPVKHLDKWVIYNDNSISANVTKLINVILSVTMRYDEFIINRTQIKESLAIGISYRVL